MVGAQSQLQALHARYHASLPNKRASVELAWRAICANDSEPARLESLMRLVHRLAGSAPSYGYREIGEVAASADALIEQYRRADRCASTESEFGVIVEGLTPLITRLLQALDQAASEPAREQAELLPAKS